MKVIILGCHSPFPSAKSGTSGYLIQTQEGNFLIDCGSGVLSQLHKYVQSYELDGVIISHTHADHITDLSILKYAIDIPLQKKMTDRTVTFYGPIEHEQELSKYQYKNSLIFQPVSCMDQLLLAGVTIEFCSTNHSCPCYAMKMTYNDKTIVYTADTGYSENLINFSKNVDFFIAEATMLEQDYKPDTGHLTAKQAGEMATKANVRQLLLTHIWPYYDSTQYLIEAQHSYAGPITVAEQGQEYYII